MKAISFIEQTCVLAKDQSGHLPLPVHLTSDGVVTSCWQLTFWERLWILFTGRLWIMQVTFDKRFQPQLPQVEYPFKAVFKSKNKDEPKAE